MKSVIVIAIALVLATIATTAVLWSGTYNIAADEPHWPLTHTLIGYARERSITARMEAMRVPDLADPARIASGAGNYNAMCVGCHLKPGLASSELNAALYPRPLDLTRARNSNPTRDFWIVKHGIKMSGMPAWGKSMNDTYIWAMVAFLQTLPKLTPPAYAGLVGGSAGHQHGGGETSSPHLRSEQAAQADGPPAMRDAEGAAPAAHGAHEHDQDHEHASEHAATAH